MNVHFIAIGGAAMHNLALALHAKGCRVTGSDDEIFDPARTRLASHGLLPPDEGWHPERITPDLDAVVLGMHARRDNPELLRAQQLGLKIYSYPEYLFEQSKDKLRIVVGGSHGKTTTTAIILHVLRHLGIEADYMVGAQLKGFDVMVRLSDTAPVMVIEGDEYLTSPLDPRSKFLHYHPDIAIVTGIEWDHVNVFPTFDSYRDTFRRFVASIEPGGTLVYCAEDDEVCCLADGFRPQGPDAAKAHFDLVPYTCPDRVPPLRIFGHHNLLNMTAARLALRAALRRLPLPDGLAPADFDRRFDEAMASFEGAAKRLELVKATDSFAMYKDFAHAPSKVRATVAAMREHYPDRRLVAALELHTFSSLTADFLALYAGTMDCADRALVYFSQHALALKKLPPLDPDRVRDAFGGAVEVFTDSRALVEALRADSWSRASLLMMSSGNFDGIDFAALADELLAAK